MQGPDGWYNLIKEEKLVFLPIKKENKEVGFCSLWF